MKHSLLGKVLVSVLALGLLAGCETYEKVSEFVTPDNNVNCPDAVILANAAVLPAFDPREGTDPTAIVYTVGMSKAKLHCTLNKRRNRASSSISLQFTARRATGGPAVRYRIPYFVAATINGHILQKDTRWQEFEFDEGAAVATFDAYVGDLETVASRRRRPSDYHFIVGFQLTGAQLEHNKQAGQYTP